MSLLISAMIAGLFGPSFIANSMSAPGAPHRNFRVAVYIPVQVVEHMKDQQWFESSWNNINRQVKVDKVYIETYRSGVIADDALIDSVKKFFLDRHVQVAGGIAFAAADAKQFRSFCYTDPKERAYVRHVAQLTARHFNDIILDDFSSTIPRPTPTSPPKGARHGPSTG